MFTSLIRIIRAGWRNFIRNGGLSAATIFVLVLTIFLMSSLFLLKGVTDFVIVSLQEKVDISVYFKLIAREEDILKAKDEVVKIPEVKDVQYISREEALEKFIARYKDNPIIMESLNEVGNPLLASLNIKAWEASQYSAVASFFEKEPYKELVDKVDYHERQPVIERIFSITANVSKTGIIFSLVLAVFAVLVTFSAIRLAIHDSREEVGIMRLVGSSNFFIRSPFLVQGAFSGLFASVIALAIFSATVYFLSPKLAIFIPDFNLFLYFTTNFWTIFAIQFITGLALGIFSSGIAVRKYLKV